MKCIDCGCEIVSYRIRCTKCEKEYREKHPNNRPSISFEFKQRETPLVSKVIGQFVIKSEDYC